jgi:hypothetical protein
MTPLNQMQQVTAADPVSPSSSAPASASAIMSVNLQQRLARVSEQFGTIKDEDIKDNDGGGTDNDEPVPKLRRLSIRLDRLDVDGGSEDVYHHNSSYLSEAVTAEEEEAIKTNTGSSPHVIDAAVTAAVNEAISDMALM